MQYVNDLLINFGFGFAQFMDNSFFYKYEDPVRFPMVRLNNKIPFNKRVWFLPPAIAPDEVFTYLSPHIIPNTANRYIISNYGRIYDVLCNRFVPFRYNKKYDSTGETRGYSLAHISHFITIDRLKSEDIYVHRAVMMSFKYFPGCEQYEVNHLDGIHLNNNINNLEWTTPEENMKHSMENKLRSTGADNIGKKKDINIKDADNICKLYVSGRYNINAISNELNIQKHTIFNVLSGVVFREVSMKYGISLSSNASIPVYSLELICQLIAASVPISDISAKSGISKYELLDIKNHKIYTEISSKYDFSKAIDIDGFRRTLSSAEVGEICRRLQYGEFPSVIADDFDINVNIVSNIKAGSIYKEISQNYTFPYIVEEALPDELVESICFDLQSGMRNVDIANKYNISAVTIGHIRRGETYTYISCKYTIPSSDEIQQGSLSNETVRSICEQLEAGMSPQEVSTSMGIDLPKINSIKSGTSYANISSQYNFPRLTNVITDEQVRIACEGLSNKAKTGDILKAANISKRTLYRIRDREKYIDISKDYQW